MSAIQQMLLAGGATELRNVAYIGTRVATTSSTLFDFGLVDFGTASSDRYVVIVGTTLNTAANSVEIGGTAATLIGMSGPNTVNSFIAYVALPSTSNARIKVGSSSTMNGCGIGIYSLNGFGTLAISASGSGRKDGIGTQDASVNVYAFGAYPGDVCIWGGSSNRYGPPTSSQTATYSGTVVNSTNELYHCGGYFVATGIDSDVNISRSGSLTKSVSGVIAAFN